MKKLVKYLLMVALLSVATCQFSSCEKEAEVEDNSEQLKAVLNNYVNSTILPTYKALAEAALDMRTANNALKNNPSNETMKAASDAWMAARIWWELSEAYLFGPVAGETGLDVDGHIDSWPLELMDIQKSIEDENGQITGKEAWLLEAEVIGFHVAEYLLYDQGKSRPIENLSVAELNYLTAVTDALVWDCVLAYAAWIGEDKLPDNMKVVFNENPDIVAHLENNAQVKNYAYKLTNAVGYSSLEAAVTEISTGIITIADEVGATKINAPYESGKVEDVESWYSWHSLDDYQNNIQSIKNAYLGGVNDNTRTSTSLSTYVAARDAQLDKDAKAKIDDCIVKIQNIGKGNKSFYEVVRDQINEAEVDAAVEACEELTELFGKIEAIIIE